MATSPPRYSDYSCFPVMPVLNPRKIVMAAAMMVMMAAAAVAQQETAVLTGVVRDASGGMVPGATVTVTNAETGIATTTVTADDGAYTVPSLRPGTYDVAVEIAGFSRSVRRGVVLQVAQVARLDVTLQTGAVSESVEVTGGAPLLETQTSSRGSVIDQKKIVDLPLNGRDYNQLALLSPGVLPATPRLASVNFKGVFNVNGNRTFNNVFLLDGVDNISYSNSFRGENVQLVQPSIEALQEFKIQTNAYSAEFGRSSGAVINATIKSGTNRVRGSAYEFLRNDALDANNFFSNALDAPKPERKPQSVRRGDRRTAGQEPHVLVRRLRRPARSRRRAARAAGADGGGEGGRVQQRGGRSVRGGTAGVQPQRAGPVGDSARSLGSGRRRGRRADSRSERAGHHHLRVDAGDRDAPGSVRRAARSSGDAERVDASGATASSTPTSSGRRRCRASRKDRSTTRSARTACARRGSRSASPGLCRRRWWAISGSVWRAATTSPSRRTSASTGRARSVCGTSRAIASIMGGLPKMNIQGFDAVGRHTSTPQFQTPRSWNPRATFSWTRGAHFIKFGGEFLHVETKINDLNATVGRMNFENRFTNRAVGDLLLGLPSQLALTSYSVMDQSQNM